MDSLFLFDGHQAAVLPAVATLAHNSHNTGAKRTRVILAHSATVKRQAELMIHYLAQKYPQLSYELKDLGSCVDFDDCLAALDSIDISTPYILNYTDGSRVSAACAVWKHLSDHREPSHNLRHYLDNYSGRILFDCPDSQGSWYQDVAFNFDVKDMVGVSGYELTHTFGPLKLKNTSNNSLRGARNAVASLCHHLNVWNGQKLGHEGTDEQLLKKIEKLKNFFDGLDYITFPNDVVGPAGEIAVACLATLQVHHAGVDPAECEILGGVCVKESSLVAQGSVRSSIAEFDVVVRVRQKVIHFEVKRSDYLARGVFAERDALGRFAFGVESLMWTVALRTTDAAVSDEIEDMEDLGHIRGTYRDRIRFDVLVGKESVDDFGDQVRETCESFLPSLPPDPDAELPSFDHVDALTCSLGIPSAVGALAGELAALRASAEDSVSLGCLSVVPFRASLPDGVTRNNLVLPVLCAEVAYRVACETTPFILGITSGPKWAIGGFVRNVFEQFHAGEGINLFHLDRTAQELEDGGFRRCVRLGNPGQGWNNFARQYEESFDELASTSDYRLMDECALSRMPQLMRDIAYDARTRDIEVYVPTESDFGHLHQHGLRFEEAADIDVAILTGRHITGMVVVVGQHWYSDSRPSVKQIAWARKRIVEEEARIEALFGGLNRVLVAMPHGFDNTWSQVHEGTRSPWASIVEANDWFSILHYGPPGEKRIDVPDEFWRELQ